MKIEKEKYPEIVEEFRRKGDMNPDELTALMDTIEAVSPEIYEHYRALCDMMKVQLQRIRRICETEGCESAFPEDSVRTQLAGVIERACAQKVILAEKYRELVWGLKK